jgi:hypothetical protein
LYCIYSHTNLIIYCTRSQNGDGIKKQEFLLELLKRYYNDESERRKGLDDKAGKLIGYATIVTGLIIGLGTF